MSYDCEFGVRVVGIDGIVHFRTPRISNPTSNLRRIFCAAMCFEFRQGEWYRMDEMMPRFREALDALKAHPDYFRTMEPGNRWGTVEDAEGCFASWLNDAYDIAETVPINCLWWRW